ncbi:MAG TPA: hypothetical protein GX716_02830 [Firmicutes bacterium]|nr:hypothetical protein [Candidatus Fermentithermobacillaceae bacterium]
MAYDMRDPGGGGSTTSGLLYRGSKGQSVRELQQQLKNLGYDVGEIDGDFGPKTETALLQFQKDAGIGVDAIAGPETFAALQSGSSKPKSQPTQQPTQTQTGGGSKPPPQAQPTYQAPQGSASGLEGYMALMGNTAQKLQNQMMEFSQLGKQAMAPYEELIRSYLTSLPGYAPRPEDELLALARQQAQLVYDPQRLALQQQIEELERQAGSRKQEIEAAYAGAEESTQRMLQEARRQATESAIARGGGRSGQVDYFTGKLQEPIMTGFQQQQAQRAASLADIESALATGQSHAAQRLEQLAQQEGLFTSQQLAAMRDTDYSRTMQEWQQGLQAAMGLAGLAGQQNIYNMGYAQSLLPYLYLTESERQRLPMQWADLMGQVPDTLPQAPSPVVSGSLVPVRAYAASQGKGNLIDWDEKNKEVVVGNVRIPIADVEKLGGKVEDGVAYLPQNILNSFLGVA